MSKVSWRQGGGGEKKKQKHTGKKKNVYVEGLVRFSIVFTVSPDWSYNLYGWTKEKNEILLACGE